MFNIMSNYELKTRGQLNTVNPFGQSLGQASERIPDLRSAPSALISLVRLRLNLDCSIFRYIIVKDNDVMRIAYPEVI